MKTIAQLAVITRTSHTVMPSINLCYLMKKILPLLVLLLTGSTLKAQNNTATGTNAGNGGNYNSSFGYFAGDIVTGSGNTFIGAYSGPAVGSGSYNSFLGAYSGNKLTTGSGNTYLGNNSGYYTTIGSNNSFFGTQTGYSNTGNNNTYLGYQAGYANTSGTNNIFLGYLAGSFEMGSNKLYIENSSDLTTPLIYGDFSANQLSINAKPSGSHALTVGGTVHATGFYVNGQLLTPGTPSQWTTNGSTINYATGNVGIGVASPNAQLHLSNIINNRRIVLWEGYNNDHQYYGLGINGGTLRFQVSGPNDAFRFFSAIDGTSSKQVFTVLGNGNVGIGEENPGTKLRIVGNGSHNVDLSVNGRIFTGDAQNFGGVWVNTMFMGQSGASQIGFHNNGDWRLTVNEVGNVGIGTSTNTPTGKLQVNGRLVLDNVGTAGPVGGGSLLSFSSGGSDVTAIQENWGLNLNGSATMPVKVRNTSLLVGYTSSGINYGQGNLLAAGNVGIGTMTPNAQLQLGNVLNNRKLVLYEDANNDNQYYGLGVNTNTFRFQLPATGRAFRFFSANDAASSNELFTIQGDGKVGIGTAAPTYPLHVAGKIGSTGLFLEATTPAINTSSTAQYLHIYNHLSAANGLKAGGLLIADDYGYASPGKNDLIVKGKVAIGTPLSSNPNNYTLAVNGQIGAKDVRVEATSATWPDYVFEKDYALPTLKEVESYLQENKHLREVPSAQEVAEKGHSLGDMDALLLKKIEELTLYLIDQNKQVSEQSKQMIEQNKRMIEQSKQVSQQNQQLLEQSKQLAAQQREILLLKKQLEKK